MEPGDPFIFVRFGRRPEPDASFDVVANKRHKLLGDENARPVPLPPLLQSSSASSSSASPDPLRYVRLWTDHLTSLTKTDATMAATSTPTAGYQLDDADDDTSNRRTIQEELELAAFNQRMWEKIDEVRLRQQQQRIAAHAPQAAGSSRSAAGSDDDDTMIIDTLFRELDRVTVLPRLLSLSRNLKKGRPVPRKDLQPLQQYWDVDMIPELKYNRHVAWALVRATEVAYAQELRHMPWWFVSNLPPLLPAPFQEMLWNDPNCPLRHDRDLMLASLEHGGLHESFHVPWSSLLETDRPLLLKLFERSPWSLDPTDDVPVQFLEDPELFRTFQRSKWIDRYREKIRDDPSLATVVNRFSPTVQNDKDDNRLAQLVSAFEERSSPRSSRTENLSITSSDDSTGQRHPFLDDPDFILFAVHRVHSMHGSHGGGYSRNGGSNRGPVRFEHLSPMLQESRDIILAYAALDPTFWRGSSLGFSADGNVAVDGPSGHACYDLRQLPYLQEVITDRDVAVRTVFLRSFLEGYNCTDWTTVERVQEDREFWIQMAETHRCPVKGWDFIPNPIAADPVVILAWARHATVMTSDWILWADDTATVLSDRPAVRNCLRQMLMLHDRTVWERVERRRVLDPALWTDVLSGMDVDTAQFVFDNLSNAELADRVIVGAVLRCEVKCAQMFLLTFYQLPAEMQVHHADLLVEALRNDRGDNNHDHDEVLQDLEPAVYQFPEVVDAALSGGWRPWKHVGIRNIVEAAPWSKDHFFVLSMARRYPADYVWDLFTADARRNKDLMIAAVRSNAGLWRYLSTSAADGDDVHHPYDFDLLCGALSGPGRGGGDALLHRLTWPRDDGAANRRLNDPTARLRAFAIEVRRRLTAHLSLTTLMGGIHQSRASSASASVLSMLNQDPDTVQALEDRFAALLGAPTDPNDIADCRRASNALTRYGY